MFYKYLWHVYIHIYKCVIFVTFSPASFIFLFFFTEMSRQTATALPTGTSKYPRSQRIPALTGTTASNNDLASLFECPVCFDYVLPPILQCQSGHLVCSNCRPKLTCCPTCRGPLGSIRNLAMEKVANSVLFPCKYASSGCEITAAQWKGRARGTLWVQALLLPLPWCFL